MDFKKQAKPLAVITTVFVLFYWLPIDSLRLQNAVIDSLALARWYAREHVLTCLVPAFFIAGAISVFVSNASVMKYLGAGANKVVAYGVASVSGAVLAVCSCTVLPLFAGIYKMGAGLGPATAFLYSGPAINVLAIILTASVLGIKLGVARAVGAVVFSIVIGLVMHLVFRKEQQQKAAAAATLPEPEVDRPLWQNLLYFAAMVGVLVFANWGRPGGDEGFFAAVYHIKWYLTSACALGLGLTLVLWFDVTWWALALAALPAAALAVLFPSVPALAFTAAVVGVSVVLATGSGDGRTWLESSWGYTKQILPLLFAGVLVAGLLLGHTGDGGEGRGLIPRGWVQWAVGGNSLWANLFASVAGAFMYFATLTEVPILKGLMEAGMGDGPALALLLAGPALSLPNMLVIHSVMGLKKTVVFVTLVVVMATLSGVMYGAFVA